jgi:hypothetical protein
MPGIEVDQTMTRPLLNRDASGRLFLRLERDDAVEIIERLRETHADAMGRAYMIHLDTLAHRLGAKWEAKRDLVFEHLKVNFERKFPEPNWCIRLDDECFLAVILTLGEYKGALSAADLWFSASQFFVGDVSHSAPPLYEAIAEDVDRMRLIPIDLNKYFDRAEARPLRPADAPLPPGTPEPARRTVAAVGTMTQIRRPAIAGASISVGGWNLRVASAVEPVFEMKKLAMIGHRLDPVVVETSTNVFLDARAIGNMDWADREQIDLANIEQGLNLLRMRTADQRRMVMVVPAAFSTFASARARARLLPLVGAASREMGLKVLFEIRHLNGVPLGRISEIVALLRPHCMTVMGHVTPDVRAIAALKGCGLAGVCIDFDGVRREDGVLEAWLAPMAQAARAATGACMVQGFDNLHQMAVARLAGVSHATIKASALVASRT